MNSHRQRLLLSIVVALAVLLIWGAATARQKTEQALYGLTMRHIAAPPAIEQAVATQLVKIAEAAEPKPVEKAPAKPVAKKAAKPQSGSKTLDEWVENLMLKESQGRTTFKENGYLPYIIDVNGLRSYSCLQFQRGTFDDYSKKHGITGDITDCATQKKLVKAMIQENRNNWRHWYNSTMKIGLPPL